MDHEEKKRLEAFETMYRTLQTEHDNISQKMEVLRADGREKSASYKELLGRKMIYKNMLELYKIYDL